MASPPSLPVSLDVTAFSELHELGKQLSETYETALKTGDTRTCERLASGVDVLRNGVSHMVGTTRFILESVRGDWPDFRSKMLEDVLAALRDLIKRAPDARQYEIDLFTHTCQAYNAQNEVICAVRRLYSWDVIIDRNNMGKRARELVLKEVEKNSVLDTLGVVTSPFATAIGIRLTQDATIGEYRVTQTVFTTPDGKTTCRLNVDWV